MQHVIRIKNKNIYQRAIDKHKSKISKAVQSFVKKYSDWMGNDSGFEKDMAWFISNKTGISPDEIYDFMFVYESWDKVLISCAYAKEHGIKQLDQAWFRITELHPGVSTETLYKKYAKLL